MQVIYNAIDERFLTAPDEATTERVRQRYQLDHPFVLYVGNIKPHKNIERMIEAFGRSREDGPDELKLVIIGDEVSKYPSLRQMVHRHKLDKHVRFLGFQPQETLASFYRLAGAFVFPSLYEGFGLPPLEAMACGTPVITSNVSSSCRKSPATPRSWWIPTMSTRSPARSCAMFTRPTAAGHARRAGPRPGAAVLVGRVGGQDPRGLRRSTRRAVSRCEWRWSTTG